MRNSKQQRPNAGAFSISNGKLIAGRDPVLVLFERADGTLDLLKPRELPDGDYQLFSDGVTRAVRRIGRPTLATYSIETTSNVSARKHSRNTRRRRGAPHLVSKQLVWAMPH